MNLRIPSKLQNSDWNIELLMQGTPINIIVGSHVWVEDPEIAWIDGTVSKINGNEVEIQTTDGRKVIPSSYSARTVLFDWSVIVKRVYYCQTCIKATIHLW